MFRREELIRQLLVSAALGDHERVRYLIEHHQIPVDSSLKNKPSALCYAAMKGDAQLTQYLLYRGADVNYCDYAQQTPLHYASLGGHAGVVQCLLQHGANPEQMNCVGNTALNLACNRQAQTCCALLAEAEGVTVH